MECENSVVRGRSGEIIEGFRIDGHAWRSSAYPVMGDTFPTRTVGGGSLRPRTWLESRWLVWPPWGSGPSLDPRLR
jgi:hypothetical protein